MGRAKVSVGLPTYNRVGKLRRAVESVLGQDYGDVELVISDNASSDETEPFCRALAARDSRVRYVRQPTNRGLTANYMATLREARGEFFLWLSDDDWLDPGYVSACLAALADDPRYVSACGRGHYVSDEGSFLDEEADLTQASGPERVLTYLENVGRNSTFYGLMRRELLSRLELPNAIGGDWMLVASVAFLGRVKVLDGVFINRSAGGNSEDFGRLRGALGLGRLHAAVPYFSLAQALFADIGWRGRAYDSLGRAARLRLAAAAFRVVARRHAAPYTRTQLRNLRSLAWRGLTSPGKVARRIRRRRAG